MMPLVPRPLQRCLAAILAGLVLVLSMAAAEPPVKVVVQLPYLHQFQFAGLYAAQTQGYFLERGLEVELRTTDSERRSSLTEVLEGRAQFGISQGPQLVASRLNGKNVVVVAAIMQHSPQVLVARAEDKIHTPHDLIGKRVALDQTSLVSEVRLMLEREGVAMDRIVVIPNEWSVNEVEARTADAMSTFVIDTPYELEKEGIKVSIIRPVDYGVDFYGDCLFTSAATVRDRAELVEAMRRAVAQGWDYALHHQEEMVDWILANHGAQRPALNREQLRYEARQVARLINADLVGLGHMNEGRWRVMGELTHALYPETNLARLEGFIYAIPETEANRFQWIFRWLWWGLSATVAVALLALLANWRLRRLVERRTHELQESERRQREIFDLSPAPITRNDYGAILPHLQKLRAGGVTDLGGYLDQHPDLLREWCGLVRVIDANQLALRVAGVATVEELDRQRMAMMPQDAIEIFRRELQAIWDGRDRLRLEKSYQRRDGRRLDTLINWSAPPRAGRPDFTHVQLVHTDLTEIHEAGRALRESEERYRLLFEQSPMAIVEFDHSALLPWFDALRRNGVTDLSAYFAAHPEARQEALALIPLVDVNQPTLALLGAANKQELVARLPEVFTERSIRTRSEYLVRIWNGVWSFRGEIELRRLDGSLRTLAMHWRMQSEGGRASLRRTQTVLVDITERLAAEQALRESEERYRLLFEQSPMAIVEFDYAGLKPWFEKLRGQGVTDLAAHFAAHPEARQEALSLSPLVDINQPTLKMLGAAAKPELVARLADVLTDQARRIRCENVVRIWEGVLFFQGEIELRRLDGSLRTMAFHWRMQSEGGKPSFRRTQTVLVDITEKLAAEQALRESESRYRGLFENAVGGIYRSTPEGRFITVNAALARMLGFASAQELIDYDISKSGQPFYIQPGRREEFLAQLVSSDHVTNFESEVRCKNGSTIWVSENVRIMRDAQGKDLYHEGFVSDITTHRRLDEEMQRASKLEAVGILAGGIAHDFNNILTVVLGNITLAEMDAGPEAPGAKLLREAKRATLRARDLTQQLLTFAKGGEPVRAAVNLPELLRETTDFALHGAKARAEYQVAADLWPVNADKGQLGQVVQNLAINSVQAMPEGGILRVSARNTVLSEPAGTMPLPAGRYVHLTVADTGTGIAAEYLSKIFDPYFTTKQHGSGLGLATVYSIIKKHQGHIEVESQLGRGTTFHLWLPAAAQAVAEKATEKTGGAVLRARVLFMDDEESIRNMTSAFMSRLRLECELAVDGAEAVRKFQEARAANRPFDVVLMDLTVPGGMGGREAMERLLKIDPNVRAIVSSGYSQDPVMASYQAHGFRGVLPKPYDLGQLRQVLEETLDISPPPAAGR